MNILSIESVCKSFGSGPILTDVTFGLEHDERMGIIGRNGSGKTTLLRIIAGQEPLDEGRVVLSTGCLVAFVPQNPSFETDQMVLDAVFDQGSEKLRRLRDYEAACRELEASPAASPAASSAVTPAALPKDHEHLVARLSELAHQLDIHGGWDLEANAKGVLNSLGFHEITERVGTLSGGQRKRLALARGLILRPDLLILDEPTNHLDADTIAWLEGYLVKYTGALLLVTHDRYFLDRVANRMLEIEKGRARRYEGNYTSYLEKKEEQAVQREAEAGKREGMIRREQAWLRQGAQARSTKQKAHVVRAKSLIAKPWIGPEKAIDLSAPFARLGNKILELEGITKAYDGRVLIDGFSYRAKQGDRVGFIGANGSGKTTLLDIISGRTQPDSGTVEVGKTAAIGYYDQESRALAEELRVIDYIRQIADHVPTADGSVVSASQMLERFLFPPEQQFSPIGRLSGGERRRLYLLRLLMGAPNVLLLDEPTNDFDIATLMALESYLESFSGCVIVASHDRYFLDRVVDQIFRIEGGGKLRGYPGNYSAFLEINSREAAAALSEKTNFREKGAELLKTTSNVFPKPSLGRKMTFKERRELDDLEKRILGVETRKAEIEALLSAPSGDRNAVAPLAAELQSLVERLECDMKRWAELAQLAELAERVEPAEMAKHPGASIKNGNLD